MIPEDKAKETYLRITSFAPYDAMNGIPRETFERYISDALKEHAKQQAIAFDIWKQLNGYLIDPGRNSYCQLIIEGVFARNEYASLDAVYDQFIESQNK